MKKNPLLFQFVVFIFRIGIGGLFVLSGISKLLDIPAFVKVVHDFDILPDFLIPVFSISLPIIELLTGLCVVIGLFIQPALLFIMMMLMAFIAVIIPNLGGEKVISECGCFGGLLKSEVGVDLLIRDIVFLILSVIIYSFKEHNISLDKLIEVKR